MKRVTMELGGHAPAIVFDDADVDTAAKVLAANKFRNAGQVCVSPTRFLVQEKVYDEFVEQLRRPRQGGEGRRRPRARHHDGSAAPIRAASPRWRLRRRRRRSKGAKVQTGGQRIGNKGNFFEPTVLTDVPLDARVMNEEPFGPLAVDLAVQRLRRRGRRRPTACPTASPPTPIRARPRPRTRSPRRSRAA